MDENECGPDEVASSAGAEGDVLECGPAFGQQREAAFAEAAQGAQEGVVGAVVDVEFLAVAGLFERDVDAVTCALVAGVGQDRHGAGGRIDRGQDVLAGLLDVDGVAGFDVAGPDREAAGFEQGLDVATETRGLAGVPGVDLFALDTGGFGAAPVGVV